MEPRSARLTILIDPDKKQRFEAICAEQDLTPSQVVRKLVGQYILDNADARAGEAQPTQPGKATKAR